jgi:hypothetical protein
VTFESNFHLILPLFHSRVKQLQNHTTFLLKKFIGPTVFEMNVDMRNEAKRTIERFSIHCTVKTRDWN